MDYRFVKTFAEKIADEADIDKLIKEYKKKADKSKETTVDKMKSSKEIAEDMIAEDKKELKRYHKYYYNMIMKALDITKQPRTLEEIKERVSDEIMKEPSVDWCVFLTFWLKECKIPLEARCRGDYQNLLNYLLGAADFEKLTNNSRENAVLHFALSSDCSWKQYISLMAQLKKEQKKDENLNEAEIEEYHDIYLNMRGKRGTKGLAYPKFLEFVARGLKEDEKKTKETYREFDETLDNKIREYKIKNNEEEKELSYLEIFPKDFTKRIDHARWRRAWYLSRMLSMLIEKNIQDVVLENIRKAYRRSYFNLEEKYGYDIGKINDDLWLKIDSKKVENLLKKRVHIPIPDGEVSGEKLTCEQLFERQWEIRKKNIYEYIKENAVISIDKISKKYSEVLGGQCFIHRKYLMKDYSKNDNWNLILVSYANERKYDFQRKQIKKIQRAIFRDSEKADQFLKKDDAEERLRRTGKTFDALLAGETETSREMLLLTALVCKNYGCKEIDQEYIYNMLINCRFDADLDMQKNTPFIKYYNKAFDDIEELKPYSLEFKREMFYQHYCSVFNNIIKGREVESTCD